MRSIHAQLAHIVICFVSDRRVKNKIIALILIGTGFSSSPSPLLASEIVGGNATNTQVETNRTTVTTEEINITGGETVGTNLFHQFEKFDLSDNDTARFLSDSEIQNIIGHITSGELSIIDGRIDSLDGATLDNSNANLYLINPAGILFGSSIRLNILGDFTATTATAIEFQEAVLDLNAKNPVADYSYFLGDPSGFIFRGSGPIANLGTLQVEPQKVISLLGSTVLNLGDINAPGGGIRLSAIEDNTVVRINQKNRLLALEMPIDDLTPQTESSPPKTAAELLTGGNPDIAEQLQIDPNGVRLVRNPGPHILIPKDSNSVINSGNLLVDSNSSRGGTIDLFGTQIGVLDGQIEASGLNGGTIRIGSEYSEDWGTESIYIDAQAVLAARDNSTPTDDSAQEDRTGGQIIFRENNSEEGGGYNSHGRYINQIYGDLDVQSLSPSGSGGSITMRGAGRATTYLANTHLEGNGGQAGQLTFEAINIEISNVSPSTYINNADSLFANPANVNPLNASNDFKLPQSTLESFSNLKVASLDNIILRDLAENRPYLFRKQHHSIHQRYGRRWRGGI